jgi:putative PIN family toxin of toxin-antitoxin system
LKILADTNILISALFYPGSKPAMALYYAANNHNLVLCTDNISELHRIAKDKFGSRLPDIDVFLAELAYELVSVPASPQKLIADPKDMPILNAAIIEDVDIIVSGDKHFLNLDIERPKVMKAAEYLEYIEKN